MVQCEMCGTDVASPNRVKVEGAVLDVCDACTDFGTEIRDQQSSGGASTKYSTGGSGAGSSSGGGSSSNTSTTSRSGGGGRGGGGRGRDMFDDIDDVAQDYDDRIRQARESRDLSQEDLAKKLNEKASLIRKLERGSMLPSDDVQRKLERELDVDLSESGAMGDEEWDSGGDAGGYTLGDVVERKD